VKEVEVKRYVIDQARLPAGYPTHAHDPSFWESLGRAVATFGFLEEVLLKAIFVFTVTTPYEEGELEAAYAAWLPKMTRSLSDPLSNLIDTYGKAVREHPSAHIECLDDLLVDLRAACKTRNALRHGSWHVPDSARRSVPFYVNRLGEMFETAVDCAFLDQLQRAVADLSCAVMNTVTYMGWQFPGSGGPGHIVWRKGSGTSEAGV